MAFGSQQYPRQQYTTGPASDRPLLAGKPVQGATSTTPDSRYASVAPSKPVADIVKEYANFVKPIQTSDKPRSIESIVNPVQSQASSKPSTSVFSAFTNQYGGAENIGNMQGINSNVGGIEGTAFNNWDDTTKNDIRNDIPNPLTGTNQQTDTSINLVLSDLKADIDGNNTIDDLMGLYPDVPAEILPDLYTDIKNGTSLLEIKGLYPELQGIKPSVESGEAGKYDYNLFNKPTEFLQEQAQKDGPAWAKGAYQWAALGTKGLRDITQGGAGLLDKGISQATDTKEIYKSNVSEDLFDITQGFINTAAAYYAPTAVITIGTALNSLPKEAQEKVATVFNDVGGFIGEIPGLKQLKESLPVERQQEFEQEVLGAMIGLLLGAKNKGNIIKNPKLFFKENINPKNILTNIEENVFNIPGKTKVVTDFGKGVVKKGVDAITPSVIKPEGSKVGFTDRVAGYHFGLNPDTINTFRQNPDLLQQIDDGTITKEGILDELKGYADESISDKKGGGNIYSDVYKDGTTRDSIDVANTIEDTLKQNGIRIVGGKVVSYDAGKIQLEPAEFSALKSKFDTTIEDLIRNPRRLGVEEMHGIRKDIYKTSFQDGVMTKKAGGLQPITEKINSEFLHKVPGFKELDIGYKSLATEAQDIIDTILVKSGQNKGEFKGTLKSLLGEKQAKRLDKIEAMLPGITKKLEVLMAYDDYIRTRETQKTGAYGKGVSSAIRGAAGASIGYNLGAATGIPGAGFVGGFLGGVISTAFDQMITDPQILKNWIIKKAGKTIYDKIEKGQELSKIEKIKLNVAMKQAEERFNKRLPYNPEVNTPNNTRIITGGPKIVSGPDGSKIVGDRQPTIGDNYEPSKPLPKTLTDNMVNDTKSLPSPESVTKSNLGTDKNPIVGKAPADNTKLTNVIEIGGKTPYKEIDRTPVKEKTILDKAVAKKIAERKAKVGEMEDYLVRHNKARASYIKSVYETYSGDEAKAYIKDWDNKYGKQATLVRKELGIAQTRKSKQEIQSEKIMKAVDTVKGAKVVEPVKEVNKSDRLLKDEATLSDPELKIEAKKALDNSKTNKVQSDNMADYKKYVRIREYFKEIGDNSISELEITKTPAKPQGEKPKQDILSKAIEKVKSKKAENTKPLAKSEKGGIIDSMKTKDMDSLYEEAKKYKDGWINSKNLSIRQMLVKAKEKGYCDFIEVTPKKYFLETNKGLYVLFNDGKRRQDKLSTNTLKDELSRLKDKLKVYEEGMNDIGIYSTKEDYQKLKPIVEWMSDKLK